MLAEIQGSFRMLGWRLGIRGLSVWREGEGKHAVREKCCWLSRVEEGFGMGYGCVR